MQPPTLTPLAGPLRGHFANTALREGIHLHCTDIVQLQDMHTQQTMPDEGLKVLIRLQGQAQVHLDDQPLTFDTSPLRRCTPQGAVLALRAPATFRRHARSGERQRMVVLTLAPAWLDACALTLPPQWSQHLTMRPWQPTPRTVALTEQLLQPSPMGGALARLHQESRALELIAEALGQVTQGQAPASPPPLSARAQARMRRLQTLLDSHEADALDMRAIAQAVGSNATTLQQQFRQLHGQTIFDYLRAQRLQRAAQALQQRGVSVAEAAEIAGYSSQANFSTAFRRHFGLPPKQLRQRR